VNDPQLKAIAGTQDPRNIDRQKFVDLVSSRTDLSKRVKPHRGPVGRRLAAGISKPSARPNE